MPSYTNKTWIDAAEAKYPKRFDYSETNYIDSYNKVIIRCIDHDESFEIPPISFIRSSSNGNFCPKCRVNKKLTHDEFIEKAKEKYPLFDFSSAKYTNYRSDICIICPDHGAFSKQARRVLHGQELICPGCIIEEREENPFNRIKQYENSEKGQEPGTFYELKVTHKETGISFIKIGITSYTSYQRYKDSRYKNFEFEVLDEIHTTNLESAKLEAEYKEKNKNKRFFLPKNIWFGGRTELYQLDGYYQLKSSQVKFIRDSLIEKQGGKCPLCKRDVEMPTLDHYHGKKQYGSGLVRGAICNTCNRMTGVIENNLVRNCIDYSDAPDFLRALAFYIQNKREPYIHPSEKPKSPKLMKSSYNKLVKAVDGKQKVPPYTGKFTKSLEKLFEKYGVVPDFKKSSAPAEGPSSKG